ncbi:MAG TPA: hypothetical protein VGT05_02875 [Patescibacteria group bacterium]|nr:hypothetical protein [Patescibacteria group bacterium]
MSTENKRSVSSGKGVTRALLITATILSLNHPAVPEYTVPEFLSRCPTIPQQTTVWVDGTLTQYSSEKFTGKVVDPYNNTNVVLFSVIPDSIANTDFFFEPIPSANMTITGTVDNCALVNADLVNINTNQTAKPAITLIIKNPEPEHISIPSKPRRYSNIQQLQAA